MDINRINKDLKASIENTPFSLEINKEVFRNNPEIIQKERLEFTKSNIVVKPDTVNTQDIYISSSEDGYQIRLHIYQNQDINKNNVILYFHGGGYVFGIPEQVDNLMFKLCKDLKATIISVDYRLSPQFKFPIPVLDGYDALKWLISNGEKELKINIDAISVFGASAGGHLAAAVAQMAADHKLHHIKHQFLLYPVIHNRLNSSSMQELADAPLWDKEYAETAWLHFLGSGNVNKSLRYADLTNYDNFKNLPETTIVACELDPLRDEGIEYAQHLYRAGVRTELWVIPGTVHIFDLFSSDITNEFYNFLVKRLNNPA